MSIEFLGLNFLLALMKIFGLIGVVITLFLMAMARATKLNAVLCVIALIVLIVGFTAKNNVRIVIDDGVRPSPVMQLQSQGEIKSLAPSRPTDAQREERNAEEYDSTGKN